MSSLAPLSTRSDGMTRQSRPHIRMTGVGSGGGNACRKSPCKQFLMTRELHETPGFEWTGAEAETGTKPGTGAEPAANSNSVTLTWGRDPSAFEALWNLSLGRVLDTREGCGHVAEVFD